MGGQDRLGGRCRWGSDRRAGWDATLGMAWGARIGGVGRVPTGGLAWGAVVATLGLAWGARIGWEAGVGRVPTVGVAGGPVLAWAAGGPATTLERGVGDAWCWG